MLENCIFQIGAEISYLWTPNYTEASYSFDIDFPRVSVNCSVISTRFLLYLFACLY